MRWRDKTIAKCIFAQRVGRSYDLHEAICEKKYALVKAGSGSGKEFCNTKAISRGRKRNGGLQEQQPKFAFTPNIECLLGGRRDRGKAAKRSTNMQETRTILRLRRGTLEGQWLDNLKQEAITNTKTGSTGGKRTLNKSGQ